MEWLTQNWILVAGAVGIFLLMRRGGMGRGHAGGGHHGGAGHDAHRQDGHGDQPSSVQAKQVTDPVSGKRVDPASAVTALYRGAPVYFESRENRDRFEAAPEQFPTAEAAPPAARQRRRRGC